MNATLKLAQRPSKGVAVYRINAPAVAGSLTKSDGIVSAAVGLRLSKALPGCTISVARGSSGKWYVMAIRQGAAS